MKFLSIELDTPFGMNDWFERTTEVNTKDFDPDHFADVCHTCQGNRASRTGMHMNCFHVAGRHLLKCGLGFGSPYGYQDHVAHQGDSQVRHLLFHMTSNAITVRGRTPFLMNAVLTDTSDATETEAHIRVVETFLRLAHAVKTTEAMSVGGEYPRFGRPDEHDAFIGAVLRLRPVHLWLPSRLITRMDSPLRPMTTPRTLPKNDRYLRHIQPILEDAKRLCAMYAAATILRDEEAHYPCIAHLPMEHVERLRDIAQRLEQPLRLTPDGNLIISKPLPPSEAGEEKEAEEYAPLAPTKGTP